MVSVGLAIHKYRNQTRIIPASWYLFVPCIGCISHINVTSVRKFTRLPQSLTSYDSLQNTTVFFLQTSNFEFYNNPSETRLISTKWLRIINAVNSPFVFDKIYESRRPSLITSSQVDRRKIRLIKRGLQCWVMSAL